MKKFIVSVLALLAIVCRLSATIVVDANVLTILNDRDLYMQYLLERVDRGEVNAQLSFAAGEERKGVGFEVRKQVSYHGLVASVPEISFTTVKSKQRQYVNLWGEFSVGNDTVFLYGGGLDVGGVTTSATVEVDGWLNVIPVLIQVAGVDTVNLYYRGPFGDLQQVEKVSSDTLRLNPSTIGKLVLVVVSKNGVVFGYDYKLHEPLNSREVAVRLASLQGDVVIGDPSSIYPKGNQFNTVTHYWVDGNTGDVIGAVPAVELKIGVVGKFLYNHRLETGYERVHNVPQIVGFQVWYLDPNAENQVWIPVPSTPFNSGGGTVDPVNRTFTFDANKSGLYRIKIYTEGLTPEGVGKG